MPIEEPKEEGLASLLMRGFQYARSDEGKKKLEQLKKVTGALKSSVAREEALASHQVNEVATDFENAVSLVGRLLFGEDEAKPVESETEKEDRSP